MARKVASLRLARSHRIRLDSRGLMWLRRRQGSQNQAGASGICMHNGVLVATCKTCGGLVPSHTTRMHAEWAKGPANFRLPDNHTLTIEKAKLAGGSTGGGQFPPVATPSVAPQPVAKTNIFSEAKVAEYERASTDPTAGSNAEATRAMVLN